MRLHRALLLHAAPLGFGAVEHDVGLDERGRDLAGELDAARIARERRARLVRDPRQRLGAVAAAGWRGAGLGVALAQRDRAVAEDQVVALLRHDAGVVDLVQPAAEIVEHAARAAGGGERAGGVGAERHAERAHALSALVGAGLGIHHHRQHLLLEQREAVEHVRGHAAVDGEHRRHRRRGQLLLAAQRRSRPSPRGSRTARRCGRARCRPRGSGSGSRRPAIAGQETRGREQHEDDDQPDGVVAPAHRSARGRAARGPRSSETVMSGVSSVRAAPSLRATGRAFGTPAAPKSSGAGDDVSGRSGSVSTPGSGVSPTPSSALPFRRVWYSSNARMMSRTRRWRTTSSGWK